MVDIKNLFAILRKKMKQSNMLLVATSILGMSVGGAQASITWDGYALSYNVLKNSAFISNSTSNPTNISGSTGSKQKSLSSSSGDAINSLIKSTVIGTVNTNEITMNTGATGQFTSRGIAVSGWQNISNSANNGLNGLSVQSVDETQGLSAFNRRAFTVDAAGDYILTGALLGGVINVQTLPSTDIPNFAPPNIVDYDWSAEVRLEKSVVNASGDFIRNESDVATLILDLTQPLNELSQTVHLEHSSGTPDEFYRYLLKTQIKLETTVFNFDFDYGEHYGDLTLGALNAMGTEAAPLTISGDLQELNPVPIPGTAIFFVSGILSLFGVSRRRIKAG